MRSTRSQAPDAIASSIKTPVVPIDRQAATLNRIIETLGAIVTARDPELRGHCERVTVYALFLAQRAALPSRDLQDLRVGALLHDIGKIGIPDRILQKAGPLSSEEYQVVQRHPAIGASALDRLEFLSSSLGCVQWHHERWDGKGYPDARQASALPAIVRVVSIADAFDAMTTDRPYRRALPVGTAFDELLRNAGTQFDPELVELFCRSREDILEQLRTLQLRWCYRSSRRGLRIPA